MAPKTNISCNNENLNEMRQTFLSNAITDISTYIQLADTKVSIIMGSLVALIAGILACYEPIFKALSQIKLCSGLGISLFVFSLLCFISLIAVFLFGILTIRGHRSNFKYKSKWFLTQPIKKYSFNTYMKEFKAMTEKDLIENMAAELYKLNDINRQKAKTMKWTIRLFSVSLITATIVGMLLLINTLRGC